MQRSSVSFERGPIQRVEILCVNQIGQQLISEGNKGGHGQGKGHVDVGIRVEANKTNHCQLDYLSQSEEVDFSLRAAPDVVVGRVGGLLGEQQANALDHRVGLEFG